jgi:uncharacterized protein involved in copper resistance
MNRLLTLLLIPLLTVGNPFSHSHDCDTDSDRREGRPHIHLTGHHAHSHHGHTYHARLHHGHGNSSGHVHHHASAIDTDDACSRLHTPEEHDSDAVYVASVDYLLTSATCSAVASVDVAPCDDFGLMNANRALPIRLDCRGDTYASGPPLFLLHAALRL